MKTDELIAMLATNAAPVEPGGLRRNYAPALGAGFFASTVLMMFTLGLRPDLASAVWLPNFWLKFALPLSLLVVAIIAVTRLARPGMALGRMAQAVAIPVAAIWILSALVLLAANPGERSALLFGHSWSVCPFNIAMLSVPLFVGAFWAMRNLAPTRLATAGAFSGLLAGSAGACVYSLHCTEMAPPFLGTWYLAGIAIPTFAGALLGPRILRW